MAKLLDFKGAQAGSPLRMQNLSATEAEIIVYAGIGQDMWGDGSLISAKDFSDQLKNLSPTITKINVRLNSPGGDVFDGIAIYNRLKQHKAKKIIHIDGLAASIASIIALAGDEVIIGEGALMMIHLPWTMAWGNRTDFDNTVNRLMDVEEQMLGIYSKRTTLSKSEIRSMLEKETWINAEDAIEMGFADAKAEDTVAMAASAVNSQWISKKPTKYFSQADAVKMRVESLKNKIRSKI